MQNQLNLKQPYLKEPHLKELLGLESVDFSNEIFTHDLRGEGINYESEGWEEMYKVISNAQKLTAHLNTGYHSREETHAILCELFGYEVDKSVWVMPPFYTDFGAISALKRACLSILAAPLWIGAG